MGYPMRTSDYLARLEAGGFYKSAGKVTKSLGLLFEAHLPGAAVGSLCTILPRTYPGFQGSEDGIEAEVVGFRDRKALLMPFDDMTGVNNGSLVFLKQKMSSVTVGDSLVGRILDGRGRPIDGKGPLVLDKKLVQTRGLYRKPSDPLTRTMISKPLELGIRAVDGMLTCGRGQRVGIMAGSGVGKSILLGMIARNTRADINVIALVGERGREVREFIERDLGEEGLARSVVIVATSDSSPLIRMRAAFVAASIAEYFRDTGKDVLFMMDSVTRFCMAQREIGLSLGEPPASKGYTPSVFATLPKLLERAGTSSGTGSITGLFTVLVEGDDMDEPIADSARSILDGHIVLSRRLAERNHFPAIDVLQSTSRVMNLVISNEHRKAVAQIKEWLATYAQVEDLINIGAYVRGANVKIDQAVAMNERVNSFLRQEMQEKADWRQTQSMLDALIKTGEAFLASVNQNAQPAKPVYRSQSMKI